VVDDGDPFEWSVGGHAGFINKSSAGLSRLIANRRRFMQRSAFSYMKRSGGTFLRFCAFTVLAAMPAAAALGQATEPVTQATPASSPGASPKAAVSPVASPAASPGPVVSGTAPAVSGTVPAVTGTTPAVSGTAPAVSGTESGMTAVPSPTPASPYSIEIDLGAQRIYLLKDGRKFAEAPISSGRAGHLTPTGDFAVIEKDPNHFSNLYGRIVEKDSGRVVKSGADIATPVPKGCKFEPAPMKWFLRFDGAAGMHAGILPGYPASHGCVRMPAAKAELFYNTVDLGTPVHVFGTTPVRAVHEEASPQVAPKATPTPSPAPTPKPKHGWFLP